MDKQVQRNGEFDYLLTKSELDDMNVNFNQYNCEKYKTDFYVAKNGKIYYLYDLKSILKNHKINILRAIDDVSHFYTKSECKKEKFKIKNVEPEEISNFIFIDPKTNHYQPLFYRDSDKSIERKENYDNILEITGAINEDIIIYNSKNKPEYSMILKKKSTHIEDYDYFLSDDQKPIGLYISNSRLLHLLYDVETEMKKTHFGQFEQLPIGLLTKKEAEEMNFSEKKVPFAYKGYYKERLYDYRNEKIFRLKSLLEKKEN